MIKKIQLVILFFVLSCSSLYAINDDRAYLIQKADSLVSLTETENIDKAELISLLNSSYEIFQKLKYEKGLSSTINKLSKWYLEENQTDTSLSLALLALKYAENINDSLLKAEVFLNIGNIYIDLNNDKYAKEYFSKAINYGNQFVKASSIANIGLIYSNIGRRDSAFNCFEKAYKIFISLDDSSKNVMSNIAITNMNMGTIAMERKDYRSAKKYFNKSLRTSYSINDNHQIVMNYLNFSELFMNEDNFVLAEEVASRAYQISDSIKSGTLIKYSLLALSQVYYAKSDYKQAYDYLKEYSLKKDSLLGIDIENKIANLQMKYEVEQQQLQIRELENEQKLNAYRIFITALIILIIASIIIYYLNKRRLRNRKRMALAEQKRAETQQKLEKAKNDIIHFTKLVQENNERIECFEKELLNSNKEDNEELKKKQEKLRGMKILKDEDWVYYKVLFKEVYFDFYNKVFQIPNLTEGDKRQILLLKLGYTNKMSADVLGISTEGIKRARQRLAKKLSLKDAGRLEDYFKNL